MEPAAPEGWLRSYIRLYSTMFRVAIMEQFQYRAANYFYMIGMVVEPVIYLVVWSTIAEEQGGTLGGYTPERFAAYYIVWTLVRNMNIVFTPFGWEERIREGTLSAQLARPLHPIHYDIGFFAGWKVVVIIMWIPIAVALVWLFDPELDPRPTQIATFAVAIWGAYLIRTFLLWILGMVTFWTTRVSALFEAFFAVELLLSGAWSRSLSCRSGRRPWPTSYPSSGLSGFRSPRLVGPITDRELVVGLAAQAGWIIFGAVVTWLDLAPSGAALHGGGRMRLAWQFLRIGVMNELQYRANFVIQLLQSLVAIGTGLVVLTLIFDTTTDLSGWTKPQLLVVMGVFTIMGGIIGFAIEPNMGRLMADIQMGTFDYVLTKPADSQLLTSVREFRLWRLTDVVVGGVVLVWGIGQLEGNLLWTEVVAFIALLAIGGLMIYCFWLLLTTGAFWFVRMEMMQELFTGLYRAGQYPVGIYPGWLRVMLTFLVPIAFAVTVPSEALTDRLTAIQVGIALGFGLFLLLVTRLFWRFAIKHYSGASA